MSNKIDVRQHIPFDVNLPSNLRDVEIGMPSMPSMPSDLSLPDIDVDFAGVADHIVEAAEEAGRQSAHLASQAARAGVRVGALGSRAVAHSARTAGRGVRSGAAVARRNPRKSMLIGVLLGAIVAAFIVRRRRAEADESELHLARAA